MAKKAKQQIASSSKANYIQRQRRAQSHYIKLYQSRDNSTLTSGPAIASKFK